MKLGKKRTECTRKTKAIKKKLGAKNAVFAVFVICIVFDVPFPFCVLCGVRDADK